MTAPAPRSCLPAPHAALTTAAALALLAIATPASAADPHRFDGIWTVAARPLKDGCGEMKTFDVEIEKGVVSYSGAWLISITGTITAKGQVKLLVENGADQAVVEGNASMRRANGRWHSPTSSCFGAWLAQRK
ncbi:hypothetical protein MWN34_17320 [Ancylobacter sp. 6x-1]|uniref:DUF2147 domain-containing protein n=1 Tax=Ancylobacter crimeensis TaxID=2579147 RepID=A0ABT0DFC3_9HYPH|nr:hypothetical protein [Ancylobacter crimeensis]MCK0198660.1 hypothetical protein [Ancylobacter crimeensis]